MPIYLARDGQQSGPFSMDQLVSMAAKGSVSDSDLVWYEGAIGWMPVTELLPGKSMAAVLPTSNSRIGFTGSIIGFTGIAIWLSILSLAVVGQARYPGSQSFLMMLVGLMVFAMLGVNAIGAVLGLIAVSKKAQRRTFTIVGLALNIIEFLGILLIMFIGLSMKHA